MKSRQFLLAIALLGFSACVRANATPGTGDENGKKEDILGTVIHSDSKKPMKDVSITAYLVSKKEKTEVSDEDGNFSFDELKPGTYKFIFEKAGYKRVTRDKVVIKSDETFQLNIEMTESNDFDIMPSPFHFTDVR
jgi:hypothetical protein